MRKLNLLNDIYHQNIIIVVYNEDERTQDLLKPILLKHTLFKSLGGIEISVSRVSYSTSSMPRSDNNCRVDCEKT